MEERQYGYELTTQGYYYDLLHPVPVNVLEGRILGQQRSPIPAFIRKPGVDYGPAPDTPSTPAVTPPAGQDEGTQWPSIADPPSAGEQDLPGRAKSGQRCTPCVL